MPPPNSQPPTPNPKPALIFDLDNTLVHSKIDFAAIRRDLGALLLEVGAIELPIPTEGPQRRSIGQIIEIGDQYDAQHGTRLGAEMWQIVEAYEQEGMRLAGVEPDSAQVLDELRRRGHALGVLTNNARSAAFEALRKFGLLPYVDPILGREDVPAMKPSASGLEVARERLGSRATRLVMIGDSYLDGLAAQGAGCPFIAFRPRPGDLDHNGVTPAAIIQDLRQLLERDW
jgi:phosphoglycolate phosphatase